MAPPSDREPETAREPPIRVAIAEDHGVLRESLAALVREQPDLEMAGTAPDGESLLDLLTRTPADVVLMDINMPRLSGVEATRRLLDHHRDVKVVALSVEAGRETVTAMLESGARGYVLKQSPVSELLAAVRVVARGEVYLSAALARDCLLQKANGDDDPLARLTPRERQVLRLLAEGRSTAAVATCLKISTKTVHSHRENMMAKLGIHTIAGLTRLAIRTGLASLDS